MSKPRNQSNFLHKILSVVTIFGALVSIAADASTLQMLRPGPTLEQRTRDALTKFMETGDGDAIFSQETKTFSSALIGLEIAAPYLEISIPTLLRRSESVFYSATRPLMGSAPDKRLWLTSEQKSALRTALVPFLQAWTAPSAARRMLLLVYNNYELWTPDEFWFLNAQLRKTTGIVDFGPTLEQLLPKLSDAQKHQLKTTLYSLKPISYEQLSLLYRTSLLDEKDYTKFISKVEKTLRKHLRADDNQVSYEARLLFLPAWEQKQQTNAKQDLESLQKRFLSGDRLVSKALLKTQASAKDQAAKHFYETFKNGQVTYVPVESSARLKSVNQNVLSVDFAPVPCDRLLNDEE